MAKADAGYVVDWPRSGRPGEAMSGAAIQWLPSCAPTRPTACSAVAYSAARNRPASVSRMGSCVSRSDRRRRQRSSLAPLDQPNEKLIALLFAAEALRREGARRLVLVAPYLAYMRQDAAFHAGEAISQRVVGDMFARTFDRIVTVDAHLHRTATLRGVFPGIEADNLSAMPAVARVAAHRPTRPDNGVVGPDEESRSWVNDLAGRLGLIHAVARRRVAAIAPSKLCSPNPALFAASSGVADR